MDERRTGLLPFDPAQCRETDVVRLRALERRVHQKIEDAEGYGFSLEQQRMLNTFFDLAEEYDSRRDLLTLCVTLPRIFFGHELRVYLRCGPGQWRLARCLSLPCSPPAAEPPDAPAVIEGRFYAPIRGRQDTSELLDFPLPGGVLGWVELENAVALTDVHRLYYEKFAGRIGHQLHTRLVRAKNREHLAFIQNLVADIGHNVIVPNMTFKLFFNRLRGSITSLERLLREAPGEAPAAFLRELNALHARMRGQYEEINRHYEQTSLFLETLLRRRHFEEGRYVLEKRLVNLRQQVVEPQVQRFRSRLADRGVSIDLSMGGIPDKPVMLMVDLGLIAQVYSNLFSNAVKYTREVFDSEGRSRKFMAYGWSVLPDAFGPGRDGVKLNVFTTGAVIPAEERGELFRPGFRASTAGSVRGTGQGLAFVSQVVALHGGRVGYEAGALGNDFFIILPLEPESKD